MRLGLRIVNDIGGRHFFPTVRVGMDTGAPVERSGDWFGATVNTAARVSGVAAGGEVLLTRATPGSGRPSARCRDTRARTPIAPHVAEPVLVYAAVRGGAGSENGLPIDPVCRMAVDPDHSAGSLSHEGAEYHFCSLTCAGKFAAAPGQYVGHG